MRDLDLNFEQIHAGQSEVLVVYPKGSLVYGKEEHMVPEVISRLQNEILMVITDLSALNELDSTGLGVLISLMHHLLERNTSMVLVNPTERIESSLQKTRLYEFFEVFGTKEEVLESIRGSQADEN